MKILLTGATGYIGKRLLPALIEQGHDVVCCVRDKNRFHPPLLNGSGKVSVLEVDFLKDPIENDLIKNIDAAYYLIHSMSANVSDFSKLEDTSAKNFTSLVKKTNRKANNLSWRNYKRRETFKASGVKKKCRKNS